MRPARWGAWLLSLALAAHLWSTVNGWAGMLPGERLGHVLIALLPALGVLAAPASRRREAEPALPLSAPGPAPAAPGRAPGRAAGSGA